VKRDAVGEPGCTVDDLEATDAEEGRFSLYRAVVLVLVYFSILKIPLVEIDPWSLLRIILTSIFPAATSRS
jgi:hypothetical protein